MKNEIHLILLRFSRNSPYSWRPKIHDRIQENPVLDPVQKYLNSVHAFITDFLTYIIILSSLFFNIFSNFFKNKKSFIACAYTSTRLTGRLRDSVTMSVLREGYEHKVPSLRVSFIPLSLCLSWI